MAQEDFAASRLQQAANTTTESRQEQDIPGPFDILTSVSNFAVSDWLQLIIAVELGLIYLELNGGRIRG